MTHRPCRVPNPLWSRLERTELVLGRLSSAEPRLGQPWPPFYRSGLDLGLCADCGANALVGARGGLVRGRRTLHESRQPGLKIVHERVRGGPGPAQPLGVVLAQMGLHVRMV